MREGTGHGAGPFLFGRQGCPAVGGKADIGQTARCCKDAAQLKIQIRVEYLPPV
jgi:hypothetical protein